MDGEAAREGNARLVEAFERDFDAIYRYATVRVGRSEADDVVAETFARASQRIERFDPSRGPIRAWLFGIAANVARESVRRRARFRIRIGTADLGGGLGESSDDVGDAVVEKLDAGRRVGAALRRLPDRQQDVLLFVDGFGLSYDEAAHALGVPTGTVASRLSAGRRRFTAELRRVDRTQPGARS